MTRRSNTSRPLWLFCNALNAWQRYQRAPAESKDVVLREIFRPSMYQIQPADGARKGTAGNEGMRAGHARMVHKRALSGGGVQWGRTRFDRHGELRLQLLPGVRAALRQSAPVMDALLECAEAWASHRPMPALSWARLSSYSRHVGAHLDYSLEAAAPPTPGNLSGVALDNITREMDEAKTDAENIRASVRAAVAGFLTMLIFHRHGVVRAGTLRRCTHPGCGDFFMATGRLRRCVFHPGSGTKAGKQATNQSYHDRKAREWGDATRRQRARLIEQALQQERGKPPSKKARNAIRALLSRRIGKRKGVLVAVCSWALWRKYKSELLARIPD